jgi:hypothetical protein
VDLSDKHGEHRSRYITPRRRAFADGMEWGVRIGLLALAIGYILYLTGILRPHVPTEHLIANWHLPAHQLIETCRLHTGWSWALEFHEGDYLNLIVIAYLASVSVWCCVRIIPFLWRERDVTLFIIVLAQIGVLLLAASGVVGGGH